MGNFNLGFGTELSHGLQQKVVGARLVMIHLT